MIKSEKQIHLTAIGLTVLIHIALLIIPLKKQIEKVLLNTSVRKKLILNGYERSKKFTWEKCAKKTLKIYSSLLK